MPVTFQGEISKDTETVTDGMLVAGYWFRSLPVLRRDDGNETGGSYWIYQDQDHFVLPLGAVDVPTLRDLKCVPVGVLLFSKQCGHTEGFLR